MKKHFKLILLICILAIGTFSAAMVSAAEADTESYKGSKGVAIPGTGIYYAGNSEHAEIEDNFSRWYLHESTVSRVTIGKNVTEIRPGSFLQAVKIEEFNVVSENEHFSSKDGVLYNKDFSKLIAYPAAKNAISYTLPDTAKSIEAYAFSNNANLEEVVFNNGLEEIGDYAFINSVSLKKMDIVESIDFSKHQNSLEGISLTHLGIGNISIENLSAIYNVYDNAKTIEFLDGITELNSATIGAIKASKIILPVSLSKIEMRTETSNYATKNILAELFPSVAEIEVSTENTHFASDGISLWKKDTKELICVAPQMVRATYVLPDEIEHLTLGSFFGTINIQTLSLGKNVKTIDKGGVFVYPAQPGGETGGRSLLENFIVNSDNEFFTAYDGVLFDKQMTRLIKFPRMKTDIFSGSGRDSTGTITPFGRFYIVPKTVTDIDAYAFYDNYESTNPTGFGINRFYFASSDIITLHGPMLRGTDGGRKFFFGNGATKDEYIWEKVNAEGKTEYSNFYSNLILSASYKGDLEEDYRDIATLDDEFYNTHKNYGTTGYVKNPS